MLATAGAGVFRAADVLWAHARLGLLWWLGCLPVVTAPAATLWLIHAARAHSSGEVVPAGRAFVRYVLEATAPALRLALGHLAASAYFVLALNSAIPDGILSTVIRGVVIAALATWILTVPWSFLLLERRRRGAWDAIRMSYLCALRRPGAAAMSAASLVAGAMLLWLVPPQIALLAAAALPAAMTYIPLRCLETVPTRYLDAQPERTGNR